MVGHIFQFRAIYSCGKHSQPQSETFIPNPRKCSLSQYRAYHTCENIHTPSVKDSNPIHEVESFQFRAIHRHSCETIHIPDVKPSDPIQSMKMQKDESPFPACIVKNSVF